MAARARLTARIDLGRLLRPALSRIAGFALPQACRAADLRAATADSGARPLRNDPICGWASRARRRPVLHGADGWSGWTGECGLGATTLYAAAASVDRDGGLCCTGPPGGAARPRNAVSEQRPYTRLRPVWIATEVCAAGTRLAQRLDCGRRSPSNDPIRGCGPCASRRRSVLQGPGWRGGWTAEGGLRATTLYAAAAHVHHDGRLRCTDPAGGAPGLRNTGSEQRPYTRLRPVTDRDGALCCTEPTSGAAGPRNRAPSNDPIRGCGRYGSRRDPVLHRTDERGGWTTKCGLRATTLYAAAASVDRDGALCCTEPTSGAAGPRNRAPSNDPIRGCGQRDARRETRATANPASEAHGPRHVGSATAGLAGRRTLRPRESEPVPPSLPPRGVAMDSPKDRCQ